MNSTLYRIPTVIDDIDAVLSRIIGGPSLVHAKPENGPSMDFVVIEWEMAKRIIAERDWLPYPRCILVRDVTRETLIEGIESACYSESLYDFRQYQPARLDENCGMFVKYYGIIEDSPSWIDMAVELKDGYGGSFTVETPKSIEQSMEEEIYYDNINSFYECDMLLVSSIRDNIIRKALSEVLTIGFEKFAII